MNTVENARKAWEAAEVAARAEVTRAKAWWAAWWAARTAEIAAKSKAEMEAWGEARDADAAWSSANEIWKERERFAAAHAAKSAIEDPTWSKAVDGAALCALQASAYGDRFERRESQKAEFKRMLKLVEAGQEYKG